MITSFYKSKVRQRKYGTPCIKCGRYMEIGEECMREKLGYNSYQCMQYNEYCIKCYNKVYPKELKKEAQELEKQIKEKQSKLKKVMEVLEN